MSDGPLADVRVIEAGSLIAGPYCGQLLGDLGADVIKLEPPPTGDPFRTWGLHTDDGQPVWWKVLARNKRSVTCNLRTPEGQQIFRGLVARADVLIENFRPGTLERWGLGPDGLCEQDPRLIVARVSGFGQTGPYAPRAGYASIGEAMGGLRYVTGYPDRPPTRTGISLGDSLAGVYSCLGVLAALHERSESGEGQVVDTAIYESVLAVTESLLPDYHLTAHQRERTGATLPGLAPSNVYPSKDGEWVVLAANQDTVFTRLCAAMDKPALASDPRFRTHGARGSNMDELDKHIACWTRTLVASELLERLHAAGIPAGKINRAADIFEDPQVRAREAVAWVEDPDVGAVPMPNVVPRLSRTPGSIRTTGPGLGQHTREVLMAELGYTAAQVDQLASDGIV